MLETYEDFEMVPANATANATDPAGAAADADASNASAANATNSREVRARLAAGWKSWSTFKKALAANKDVASSSCHFEVRRR